MNGTLKGVLIFAGGAVVGSLATYFIVRDHFAKIADEEIASVKEICGKRVELAEDSVNDEEKYSTLSNDEDRVAYYLNALRELGVSIEDLDADSFDEGEEVNPVDTDGMKPEVIDENIFITQGQDMQETLHYYCKDHVLCDDQYEVIDNATELLGEEWETDHRVYLDKYAGKDVKVDELYIRNFERETDYEILVFTGSYEDAVMGGSEESDEEHEPDSASKEELKKRMAD